MHVRNLTNYDVRTRVRGGAVGLLWEWWLQIWPNLAASALVWLPAFVWHHRRIRAHISNEIAKAVNSSDQGA